MQVMDKALRLPASERAQLAAALIDSLEETVPHRVETAWQEDIARRLADIDGGEIELAPWEDMRERLRHTGGKRSVR